MRPPTQKTNSMSPSTPSTPLRLPLPPVHEPDRYLLGPDTPPFPPAWKLASDPFKESDIPAAAAEKERSKGLMARANHLPGELLTPRSSRAALRMTALSAAASATPSPFEKRRGGTKRVIAALVVCLLLGLVTYGPFEGPVTDGKSGKAALPEPEVHVTPVALALPPAPSRGPVPLAWIVGGFLLSMAGGYAAGHRTAHPEVTPEGYGITVRLVPI